MLLFGARSTRELALRLVATDPLRPIDTHARLVRNAGRAARWVAASAVGAARPTTV